MVLPVPDGSSRLPGVPALWSAPPREVAVAWTLSRHARRLLTLAAAGLLAAVLTRRPEFVGLAAPAVLLLGAARPPRPPRIAVRLRLTATRLHEDELAAIDLAVGSGLSAASPAAASPSPGSQDPASPAAASPSPGSQDPASPAPGSPAPDSPAPDSPAPDSPAAVPRGTSDVPGHEVRWTLHPGRGVQPRGPLAVTGDAARFVFAVPHWGRRQAGTVEAVLHDRWRLAEGRFTVQLPRIDVYPRPVAQRTRVVLNRLPNRLGEHAARVPGEGTEFTGIREYVPGDRQRQINWPASTRRGRLQVNTFAAERSQDVVLLVDATSDVGEPGSSALDLGLRGAAGAARAYLDARDRVGVITYQWGGTRWLAPSLGRRQVYRIIDAMLAADAGWSVPTRAPFPGQEFSSGLPADPGRPPRGAALRRLPRAALPPGALVVVFSPLLNQQLVEALRDMRERGFTLLIVDVLNTEPPAARFSYAAGAAARIWRMEQQAIRFSLRELGIPVVHWDGVAPLDLPLAPYSRRPLVVRR